MAYNGGRVLIVDDSLINRTALAQGLEQQGCIIALAEDGRKALEIMQKEAFDLVLLDILMPKMDGYQVLEHMKNDPALRDIPVIVISAIDEMDSAVRCIEMGAEDYLARPFDIVLLRARIGASLEKKRLRDREQANLKQLQRHNHALAALNQLSQQLAATLDMGQITEQLPGAIRQIIGAEGALVWLWDEKRERWLVCRSASYSNSALALPLNAYLGPGQGVAGWVAQHGKSIIIPHAPDDPRFFSGVDEQSGFSTISLLSVPLRVHYAIIGAIEVMNKLDAPFDTDDLSLVEMLATSAAIAIDNAVLFEARRQLVAELRTRNEELDAFAHTVAHDLKGSLNNIVGFAFLVQNNYGKMSSEQVRHNLQVIAQNGYKMASIVDELLLLSSVRKVETVEMESLDMTSLVAQARERLAFLIDEYGAEIVLPQDWPPALGYSPWIEEVWVNYLSNAIKYGGRPPRVELGADPLPVPLQAGAQEEGMVRFWVRDNGAGITPEDQMHLFTPFERLHQVKAKGHGLGLSIVQRIVEKLGGQVGVQSQVGHGSTFSFTLPGGAPPVCISHSN